MKIAKLAAMAVMVASLSAHAGDERWVDVAYNDDYAFSMESGSFYTTTTKSGVEIGVVNAQSHDKKNDTYSYGKWYVPWSACVEGMGKVSKTDSAGNWEFDWDFNRNGKSMSAGVGDMLCSVWEASRAEQKAKSI